MEMSHRHQQKQKFGGTGSLQMDIRNDAEELKDYLQGLKSWETEIKRRDEELLRQKHENKRLETIIDPAGTSSTLDDDQIPNLEDDEDDDRGQAAKPEPKLEFLQEAIEEQVRKQKAELEKEKGNMYMKANDLDEAIRYYTLGLTMDAHNPLLHANRSLAYLKKQQFEAAENDCDFALRLDSKYAKAFLRRAAARSALGKFSAARDDLLDVLRLEPNNPQAKDELAKVETKILNEQNSEPMVVMPIDKPPHLRSKVPLRRIPVVPVLSEADDESKSGKNIDNRKRIPAKISPAVIVAKTSPTKPDVPIVNAADLTSFHFQKEFRRLKSHPDVLYGYLKQIPAQRYPNLFQHSMESDVLSHLLRSYRDFYIPNGDDVYPLLLHLTKTKRFLTIRMFLSSDDKNVLSDLFDKLLETTNKDDVESLRNVYGMQ